MEFTAMPGESTALAYSKTLRGLMPAFVLAVTRRKARPEWLGTCVSRFRAQAVGRARIRLNRVRQRTVRGPFLQTVYVSVIKTHALLIMRQSRRI
ncbi:hypothetical protein [Paenibacillus apiarius]|uniref:hypothetical protein n=1 Tax=Paenibacillus apiarius TaxID=46240 RepID=UPI003B3B2FE5